LALFGLVGAQGAQGALFTVQIKASPTKAEADEEVRQLKAKSISAYIVKSDVPGKGVFYRVRAGVFSNRDDAKRFGANLQQRGVVSEFFVTPYEKSPDYVASCPAPTSPPPTKATPTPTPPASNAPPGDTPAPRRPPAQKRPDSATLNNASGDAPGPDSVAASRSMTAARTNPTANSATPPAANAPTRATPASATNTGL